MFLSSIVISILCVLTLCSVAIYNGYPVLFFDTQWYIVDLFLGMRDGQKSNVYSIFMYAVGGSFSLWAVIVAQAVVTNLSLSILFETLGISRIIFTKIFIVLFLSYCTSLAWMTSHVMPDIFTGLLIISLFVILFNHCLKSRFRRFFIYSLFMLSVIVHNSNYLTILAILSILFASNFVSGWRILSLRKTMVPLKLFLLSMIFLSSFNYYRTGKFFSKSVANATLTNRLIEDGIVQKLLKDRCSLFEYSLCKYSDELSTQRNYFLFENKKIFKSLGGWRMADSVLSPVIYDSFKYYPYENYNAALRQTRSQLRDFTLPNFIFQFETNPGFSKKLKYFYPKEHFSYVNSLQSQGKLKSEKISNFHKSIFWYSLRVVLFSFFVGFFYKNYQLKRINSFALIVIISILLNAIVCGFVSHSEARYGARIVWLVPLSAYLIVMILVENFWSYLNNLYKLKEKFKLFTR
jgi:hypothetical protein